MVGIAALNTIAVSCRYLSPRYIRPYVHRTVDDREMIEIITDGVKSEFESEGIASIGSASDVNIS